MVLTQNWYSDDKATLGDRLGVARSGAGLSVESLARKLGIRRRTVEAWENDEREPRANQLQMAAGVMGVSLIWLMSGQGEGAPPQGEEGQTAAGAAQRGALLGEIKALQGVMDDASRRLSRLEQMIGQD